MALLVSRSGTRFTAGSWAKISNACGHVRWISLAGTRIHNGRFAKTERRPTHARVEGRFITRRYATYQYSAPTPPGASATCESEVRTGAIYENGEPPFSGCRSQPAKTDFENDDGRIFEQFHVGTGVAGPPKDLWQQIDYSWAFEYACLFSTDKRVLIGDALIGDDPMVPRLAAPYAALPTGDHVHVVDVRNGRLVNSLPMTNSQSYGGPRVTDLELKPNHSVAWLVRLPYLMAPNGDPQAPWIPNFVEVVAVDANGRRVLDSGPDVVPDSLTLDGSTLNWINAGVTHSATLD